MKYWSPRGTPVEVRFWEKVDKNGPLPPLRPELGQCWTWIACISKAGYGGFNPGGGVERIYSHRWAYESVHGPIGDGMELDHLCRNRACCNPSHLQPVTHGANMGRMLKERCKHGHTYTPDNTYWKDGSRSCVACRRMAVRVWKIKRAGDDGFIIHGRRKAITESVQITVGVVGGCPHCGSDLTLCEWHRIPGADYSVLRCGPCAKTYMWGTFNGELREVTATPEEEPPEMRGEHIP